MLQYRKHVQLLRRYYYENLDFYLELFLTYESFQLIMQPIRGDVYAKVCMRVMLAVGRSLVADGHTGAAMHFLP